MTTNIEDEAAVAQAETRVFVLLGVAYDIAKQFCTDEVVGYIGSALAELNRPGDGESS